VVEPFMGQRWYAEAYTRELDGAVVTVTVTGTNLFHVEPHQPPPVGSDTWRDFLAFLCHSSASHPSAFEAIVGNLPIKSATFPVLAALLRARVKLSASPDGLVHFDLLSAGSGWLYWKELENIPSHVEVGCAIDVNSNGSSGGHYFSPWAVINIR